MGRFFGYDKKGWDDWAARREAEDDRRRAYAQERQRQAQMADIDSRLKALESNNIKESDR